MAVLSKTQSCDTHDLSESRYGAFSLLRYGYFHYIYFIYKEKNLAKPKVILLSIGVKSGD